MAEQIQKAGVTEVLQREETIAEKDKEISEIKNEVSLKQSEIEDLNKQILKVQDEMSVFEARLDNREGKEHGLKEEIITLQDIIKGKDTAISQLSNTIIQSGTENEKLAEMVSFFKNRLIIEGAFS